MYELVVALVASAVAFIIKVLIVWWMFSIVGIPFLDALNLGQIAFLTIAVETMTKQIDFSK